MTPVAGDSDTIPHPFEENQETRVGGCHIMGLEEGGREYGGAGRRRRREEENEG